MILTAAALTVLFGQTRGWRACVRKQEMCIRDRDRRIMEENKTSTWEEYRKRTHVIGRVVSAVTLVMLVGAPFLMGKILGAYPDPVSYTHLPFQKQNRYKNKPDD